MKGKREIRKRRNQRRVKAYEERSERKSKGITEEKERNEERKKEKGQA